MFRKMRKLFAYLSILVTFFSHSLVATALIRGLNNRRRYFVRITSKWAQLCLWVLDIKVDYEYEDPGVQSESGYLIVSNHLSYTDLFVLVSRLPAIFITSFEIKETPVLGYIARRSGCIFVERRRGKRSKEGRVQELADIAQVCREGQNVILFAEATSTNGDTVIPFKAGLFQAAVDHKIPILPVTISYQSVEGNEERSQWRDSVFWYADMTFMPHLWKLFGLRKIRVKVHIGRPIEVKDSEGREHLSRRTHAKVVSTYEHSRSSYSVGSGQRLSNQSL